MGSAEGGHPIVRDASGRFKSESNAADKRQNRAPIALWTITHTNRPPTALLSLCDWLHPIALMGSWP